MIKRHVISKYSFGFTLLELLIVLAIVASAAAMSIAYLMPANRQIGLKRAGDVVISKARQARTRAILRQSMVKLFVSLKPNTIWVEGEKPKSFAVPAGMELEITTARSQARDGLAAIMFFPDGTSSGGEIRLRRKDQAIAIKIDWVTGGAHAAN